MLTIALRPRLRRPSLVLAALTACASAMAQLPSITYTGDRHGAVVFTRVDTLDGGGLLYRSNDTEIYAFADAGGAFVGQVCAPQMSPDAAVFEFEGEFVVVDWRRSGPDRSPESVVVSRVYRDENVFAQLAQDYFPGAAADFTEARLWFRLNDSIVAKPLRAPAGGLVLVDLRTGDTDLRIVHPGGQALSFHHADTVFFVDQPEPGNMPYRRPVVRAWVYGADSASVVDLDARLGISGDYRFIKADPYINGSNDGLAVLSVTRGTETNFFLHDLKSGVTLATPTSQITLYTVYRHAPDRYVVVDRTLDRTTGRFTEHVYRVVPGASPELLASVSDLQTPPVGTGGTREVIGFTYARPGFRQMNVEERHRPGRPAERGTLFELPTRVYGEPTAVLLDLPDPELLFADRLGRFIIPERRLDSNGLDPSLYALEVGAPYADGSVDVLAYHRDSFSLGIRRLLRRRADGTFSTLGHVQAPAHELALVRGDDSGSLARATLAGGGVQWSILGHDPGSQNLVTRATGSLAIPGADATQALALADADRYYLVLRVRQTGSDVEQYLIAVERASGATVYRSDPEPVGNLVVERDFARLNRPEEGPGVTVVGAPRVTRASAPRSVVSAYRYTLAATAPEVFSQELPNFYQSGQLAPQDPGSEALVACGTQELFVSTLDRCYLADVVGDRLQTVLVQVGLPVNHRPTVQLYRRGEALTLAGAREAKLFQPTAWLTSVPTNGIQLPSGLVETGAPGLNVFPNPARRGGAVAIEYPVSEASRRAAPRLFDAIGREVPTPGTASGAGTWVLPTGGLPAGMYWIVLQGSRAPLVVLE